MNHHRRRRADSPAAVNLDSATQILKQTTTIFKTHLHTLVFLSFLILTFRSNVENGSNFLTTFIDRDPSLKSLLSRIDISGRSHSSPNSNHQPILQHRRRRPFLQLTRVGTLDDDFFSGDDHSDKSLFGGIAKSNLNGTFVIFDHFDPNLGFSNGVVDSGILVNEIVRSGFTFKAPREEESLGDDAVVEDEKIGDGNERENSFGNLFKGLELGRRDATALMFVAGILSASYGYVILGFLVTYSWVLGTVFVLVLNDLLGRYKSLTSTLWDGSNLGLKRLTGFILLRWAVRDALTQLLGICFFGEIDDHYLFFKIFVRLKLMPFSVMASWVRGYEKESAGFLVSWFLFDTLLAFVFAVDAWVAIVDSRKSGREVVKEGCHLLATMLNPAINIKCLEGILCGSLTRWILSSCFGRLFASAFQSVMEVYFMVAWLVYYFAVRSKTASSLGRTFGQRELEGILEGFR
ncbi:hypothetical protein DCAR_0310523 [Daucus carota subsp. sativus]|uniref:Uncharacterized protein n=1 Tax=Daucus carota subsp. sativus TaxID=79200 RepID=A0A165ZYB0_DAUCS|nr:PREDICTED: uncharacterized protein LOC108210492 [Daucus carota subsp. sativus]WOG91275.1 hypothetical protein DCAR_0310523 [Daucus carota subsp. sativus]